MTPRERLETLLNGESPDRPLVTTWRHFYHRETTARGLADAMLEFQNRFGWDLMKINPRASFHMEDWGNQLTWSTSEFSKHSKDVFAVDAIEDWDKITVHGSETPVLSEMLEAIRLIREGAGPDLPILMTLFTPLSIAGDLVSSDDKLISHIREDESRIQAALERITETFSQFARDALSAGADGLFYATTQWASRSLLTIEEYDRLGRSYDLRILEATPADALHLLHVCASENYLKELSDYPVQLVNWDESDPTNASLADGLEILNGKLAMGGLDHNGWLRDSTPQEIEFKVRQVFHAHPGKRFIFAPGCSMPPETPMENLEALAKTVRELSYA